VAIELQDGVALSWDGREVMHCSSVPDADCSVLSAWCSAQNAAINRHHEDEALRNELKERCVPGGVEMPMYMEGDTAGLLWKTSVSETRSYNVEVTKVLPNNELLVTDLKPGVKKSGDKGHKEQTLTADEIGKFLGIPKQL